MSSPRQLVVRIPGSKPFRIGPGQQLKLGRHSTNDVVLADTEASRFHAVIGWDKDDERPFVFDNNSANGVDIDGEPVEGRAYLSSGNQVGIGQTIIAVELVGASELEIERPVRRDLLADDSESVVLYTEKGKEEGGRCVNDIELQKIILLQEEQERTGTLKLRLGDLRASLTFCQGKVMEADHGESRGRAALREIMCMPGGLWQFTRGVTLSESTLDISVRAYLALEMADPTKKFQASRKGQPEE